MNQSPSAALLRLREADVVRFCGLAAAARGLVSVAQHAVTQGQRAENWLSATVSERETMAHAWAEAIGSDPLTIRWRCSSERHARSVHMASQRWTKNWRGSLPLTCWR